MPIMQLLMLQWKIGLSENEPPMRDCHLQRISQFWPMKAWVASIYSCAWKSPPSRREFPISLQACGVVNLHHEDAILQPYNNYISAVWLMRVGDAENERMSPSSLSLSQTLCTMLNSPKVFVLLKSRCETPKCGASNLLCWSIGLLHAMSPCSETPSSRDD